MINGRLLALVRDAWGLLAGGVALRWCALVTRALVLAGGGWVVGTALSGGLDVRHVLTFALCCVVGAAASWGLEASGASLCARVGRVAEREVRLRGLRKLVALGPSFVEQVSPGEASQVCGEGARRIADYAGTFFPQFVLALAGPLAIFCGLCLVSWPVALVLLVCLPLIPGTIMVTMTVAKSRLGQNWGSLVAQADAFLDAVRGIATLRAFGVEEGARKGLLEGARLFREQTMALLRVTLSSVAIMDFVTYVGAAAALGCALVQVGAGSISAEGALMCVMLSVEFFRPMRDLGQRFHAGMNAGPAADALFALLDAPAPAGVATEPERGEASRDENEGAADALESRGAHAGEGVARVADDAGVQAHGLGYAYADGRCALRDVDLSAPAGSFVGVTGPSGSGKSTLARVLSGELRRYDGSVTVGGVEARDLAPSELARRICVTGAAERVFSGTFRTNLMLGDPDATDYAMWNALNRVQLDDFVLRLGGLDVPLAEGGENLSGGQRQRLCLAHAVLRDAPTYVFDEVTSNVDAESEQAILNFVQQTSLVKTVILISHRLSALAWCDDVLVLRDGLVAERGSHDELLARRGLYADLWVQQRRLEQWAAQARTVEAQTAPVEADVDVPAAMADAMEKMPAAIATVARQAMKGVKIRMLTEGAAGVPAGHPKSIPLGGMAAALTEEQGARARAEAAAVGAWAGAATGEEVDSAQVASQALEQTGSGDDGAARRVEPGRRGALAVVARLLREAPRLTGTLAASTACGLVALAAGVGVPVLAACGLVGLLSPDAPVALPLAWAVAGSVTCGVVRAPAHYLERLLSHGETFRTLEELRDRVFAQLCRLAPASLARRGANEAVVTLTSDVAGLDSLFSRDLSAGCLAVLGTLGSGVACWALSGSAWLGLAAAASCALVCVPGLSGLVGSSTTPDDGRSARFASRLAETIAGLPSVMRCGAARVVLDEMEGRLGAAADDTRSSDASRTRRDALGLGLAAFASGLYCSLAAALAIAGLVDGSGAAVSAVALLASLEAPLAFAATGPSHAGLVARANRVIDCLDERPATPDVVDGAELGVFTGARLDRVSFGYEPGSDVLADVTFSVEPGEVVHVLGDSGAGKSTLLRLLMRVWDPDKGVASVSGHDLRGVSTRSLRACEGYMDQDVYLFAATLRDNVRLARPDAGDDEVADALRAAHLAEVVASLPRGLDTPLGPGGTELSDGERQRVGLARVFLQGAPLLLLDEPTSNLDCLSEAAVLQALDDMREGRTIVIVSHRATAAAIADEVWKMEPREAT